jgi:hypothetical protein
VVTDSHLPRARLLIEESGCTTRPIEDFRSSSSDSVDGNDTIQIARPMQLWTFGYVPPRRITHSIRIWWGGAALL